jgi:hypothetical protein
MNDLKPAELRYLQDLCSCEDGKGLMVHRDDKKIVSSLVRKGLAWTLASVFTVCIATDEGRKLMAHAA